MKIAVIGNGLAGMQAAVYFDLLEASVLMIGPSHFGGELSRLGSLFPSLRSQWFVEDLLLPEVAQQLKNEDQVELQSILTSKEKLTFAEIKIIAQSLFNYCHRLRIFQEGDCTLIKKQTLTKTGPILGPKRMRDLFRIHFLSSPKKSLEESFEENKNWEETLPLNLQKSLGQAFEAFLDVDAVVDARGRGKPIGMSFDGNTALGETLNTHPHIFYGLPDVATWQSIKQKISKRTNPWKFLIIGGGEQAAQIFLLLKEIEKELSLETKISITSMEKKLFADILGSKIDSSLRVELEKALDKVHLAHQERYEKYLTELNAWNELEDFKQVKISRPVPPSALLTFIPESQVQSVDKLMDQEEIYITYETSSWDQNIVLNNQGPFTLPCDFVFVANKRYLEDKLTNSLRICGEEPGFYQLSKAHEENSSSVNSGIMTIKWIEEDLKKYFKKLDP